MLKGRNGQSVTDGPYAEGKEDVGGFILLTARDLDYATELANIVESDELLSAFLELKANLL